MKSDSPRRNVYKLFRQSARYNLDGAALALGPVGRCQSGEDKKSDGMTKQLVECECQCATRWQGDKGEAFQGDELSTSCNRISCHATHSPLPVFRPRPSVPSAIQYETRSRIFTSNLISSAIGLKNITMDVISFLNRRYLLIGRIQPRFNY